MARLQSKYIISDIKGFNFFPKTTHFREFSSVEYITRQIIRGRVLG